jgi:hypothetical protein
MGWNRWFAIASLSVVAATGCAAPDSGSEPDEPSDGDTENVSEAASALSEVWGCHFYVGSNYGGATLWMARNTTISYLSNYSMNDKISSVRLRGGAATRMWIDSNYKGKSWYISSDKTSLHDSSVWGNLGDNSSSIDCY